MSEDLLAMMTAYRTSQMIHVAAVLGIADQLEAGPKTSAELATSVDADAPALDRLLRGLVSIGVFAVTGDRFALNPLAEPLRTASARSLRNAAQLYGGNNYEAWADLLYTTRTGNSAFAHRFGKPTFELLKDDPAKAAVFHAAMAELTRALYSNEAIASALDLGAVQRVVDVGGGRGHLIAAIVDRAPGVHGIAFDTPGLASSATAVFAAAGVQRASFVGGDFFTAVPEGADLYILKRVLHDWGDEDAIRILSSCARAAPPAARIVIAELLLEGDDDPDRPSAFERLADLHMMVGPGGQERTRNQFANLLERVGFAQTRVIPTASRLHLVEARRSA